MLTLLLDIPWVVTALSGWPLFGILAQLSFNKVGALEGAINHDALDGLEAGDEALRSYFKAVRAGQQTGDLLVMSEASAAFLQSTSNQGGDMGWLTAMATQAAIQPQVKERMKFVETLQNYLRQSIHTAAELDIALATRWPLWGLLHVTIDAFSIGD